MMPFVFALFSLLAWVSPAGAVESTITSTLLPGETVSHKALQLTLDASNWKKAVVVNPRTNRVYYQREFRRLPAGTEVRFPVTMVKTEPYEAKRETLAAICAKFNERECVSQLAKVNTASRSAALSRVVYIPLAYQRAVAAMAPAVSVNASQIAGPAVRKPAGKKQLTTMPMHALRASAPIRVEEPGAFDSVNEFIQSLSSWPPWVWFSMSLALLMSAVFTAIRFAEPHWRELIIWRRQKAESP